MRFTYRYILALSLFSLPTQFATAAECSAKSGATAVPLLELYTSQGCSSCPPAESWLSGLQYDTSKLTPLAFHVDYWDYIGWKDKFAKAEFSARQRKAAAFNSADFVYTPQFMLNGHDFRSANESKLNRVIETSQKLASRANLSLSAITQNSGEITLKATAQSINSNDAIDADIFVAIYENKLVSKISAGENNGRELKHDYVVREFFATYQFNNKNVFSKNFTLDKEWRKRNAGAVIFVQNNQNGEVLQSLNLPFCH